MKRRYYSERMIDGYHKVLRTLPTLTPSKAQFVFWKVKQSPIYHEASMIGAQKRVIAKRLVAMNFNLDKVA